MRYLSKYWNAFIGLWLTIKYQHTFLLSTLKGKRIVIVGAADSALKTGLGAYIDEYDIVVRVNKAPLLLKEGRFKKDIGGRIDILFHSFYEDDFSGGGPLDFKLYDELGISYVINPLPGYWGHRFSFNFFKRYLAKRVVYRLPSMIYGNMHKAFTPYRPTTGFYALYTLLNADFKELYITGFTFFRTPYADGYRDELKDVEINKRYMTNAKQHDPTVEFIEFVKLVKKNLHKKIVLDSTLQAILEDYEVENNASG